MKLMKIEKNRYRLVVDAVTLEGDLAFMVETMRFDYEVAQPELDLAIMEMLKLGHDVANFGNLLSGEYRFLYTTLQSTERNMIAELRAIQSVREEAVELYRRDGWASPPVKEAFGRLQSLLMALNVEGLIDAVEKQEIIRMVA